MAINDPENDGFGYGPKEDQEEDLGKKQGGLVTPPQPSHTPLFHIEKQTEINGVEMGVLENGIPYLTESGLARMCGISRPALNRLAVGWAEEKQKKRGAQILALLEKGGYTADTLYLESELGNVRVNAYTEPVCLALLEYYAFVTEEPRPEAINAFRSLARTTFRVFIYEAVGYRPSRGFIDSWQHFHDRVDMTQDKAPKGYWGVFQEMAPMIVPMIRADVIVDDKMVPDISVGRSWGKHWEENDLASKYGDRRKYNHEYPPYYPQSKSNPQPSYAYPDEALVEFRYWLKEIYLPQRFPTYMLDKVRQKAIGIATANKAIAAFGGEQIEMKPRTRGKLKG